MKHFHFLSSSRLGLACVMATLVAVVPLQALSQAYPTKPVKVLVGFTAGGAVDLIARSVGQAMQAQGYHQEAIAAFSRWWWRTSPARAPTSR